MSDFIYEENFFIKATINLIKSGGFLIDTRVHQIKLGVLYETKDKTILIVNISKDGLMICKEFDSNFKEIKRNSFESENDFLIFIDSLSLKESPLNSKLIENLNRYISFIKESKNKIVVN